MSRYSITAVSLLLLVFGANAHAATDIRISPGGKRLLFVDGNDIRDEPGGPRRLFVDGDAIRPAPGGKRLLFIDGSSVRPEPGGERLLFLDGNDIRKSPGGNRLLFIDGKDVRPAPGGERLLFIDGDSLTPQQLVAVLYLLKPELFAAPESEEPAKDAIAVDMSGEWKIDTAIDLDGEVAGGTVTLTKIGDALYGGIVRFKGKPDAPAIAAGNGQFMWLAIGNPGMPGIGRYFIRDGQLEGEWMLHAPDRGILSGSERFKGGQTAGTFELIEGKSGDVVYNKGTLALMPIDDTSGFGKPLVHVEWNLDGTRYVGIAFQDEDAGPLVISFGSSGQKLAIVNLHPDGDSMAGAIVTEAGKQGVFNLIK